MGKYILLLALSLSACSSARVFPINQGSGILITFTDFQIGTYGFLDLQHRLASDLATVHADALPDFAGGRPIIVNRLGQDNILFLAPDLSPDRQCSTGPLSNPYDVEHLAGDLFLVSRYGSAALLVLRRTDCSGYEVSLAPWADDDGLPEMTFLVRVGDRLLVALQRLDRSDWSPRNPAMYLVFRTQDLLPNGSHTPEAAFQFQGRNPITAWRSDEQRLYIGMVGNWGQPDGGIEAIRRDTWQSDGWVVTEQDLDGKDIADFAVVEDRFFVTATDWNESALYEVRDGQVTRLFTSSEFALGAIAWNPITGRLYIVDRNPENPGIWILDPGTGQRQLLPTAGLPPFGLKAIF